jgi:hypothetical protein
VDHRALLSYRSVRATAQPQLATRCFALRIERAARAANPAPHPCLMAPAVLVPRFRVPAMYGQRKGALPIRPRGLRLERHPTGRSQRPSATRPARGLQDRRTLPCPSHPVTSPATREVLAIPAGAPLFHVKPPMENVGRSSGRHSPGSRASRDLPDGIDSPSGRQGSELPPLLLPQRDDGSASRALPQSQAAAIPDLRRNWPRY